MSVCHSRADCAVQCGTGVGGWLPGAKDDGKNLAARNDGRTKAGIVGAFIIFPSGSPCPMRLSMACSTSSCSGVGSRTHHNKFSELATDNTGMGRGF